jgi:hypothetical protein
VEELTAGFPEAVALAGDAGYRQIVRFKGREFHYVPLP